MPQWALQALDQLLFIVHLLVVVINVFGWIWPRTRPLQRWTLLFTTISWLVLGAFYGLGYCVITDWHWAIKRQLGEPQIPSSFIQYVLRNKLGLGFSDFSVDVVTGSVFVLLLLITGGQLLYSRRKASEGADHGNAKTY